MLEFLTEYGYLGLFIASFLAATILPFSSEIIMGALLLNGADFITTIVFASTGNILGAITNYYVGMGSHNFILKKMADRSKEKLDKAIAQLQKYGGPILLFAWIPVIGDPLTVAAGFLKMKMLRFIIFMSIGKIARYYFLAKIIGNYSL